MLERTGCRVHCRPNGSNVEVLLQVPRRRRLNPSLVRQAMAGFALGVIGAWACAWGPSICGNAKNIAWSQYVLRHDGGLWRVCRGCRFGVSYVSFQRTVRHLDPDRRLSTFGTPVVLEDLPKWSRAGLDMGWKAGTFMRITVASGWPFRALRCTAELNDQVGSGNTWTSRDGILMDDLESIRVLSVNIAWPGLLADVGCHGAAATTLTLVLRGWRGARLKRLGRCESCGYCKGVLPTCPECGRSY